MHGTSRDDLQNAVRNMGAEPTREGPGSAPWETVNTEFVTEAGAGLRWSGESRRNGKIMGWTRSEPDRYQLLRVK